MTARRMLSQLQQEWLAAELGLWRQTALITDQQAAEILGLYETAQDRQDRLRSWLLYTLVALAAVLFGAAALLLVSYNWDALPAAVKLGAVFGTIAATYAVGLYLRYYLDARRLSEAVLLLGCLFYGAGIWLVAQIFHMSAHYPDGVFWWAIGVVPLALLLDSLVLHALVAVLLALWCGMEIINFPHLGAWFFGRRWPMIPNGCYLVPVIAAVGLALAYRRQSFWRVSIYVPLIVWWSVLQPIACRFEVNPIYFMGAVGALLLVLAESHRQGSPLTISYRAYGAMLFGGVLIPMSFWEFNEWTHVGESAWGVVAMSAVILAIAAVTFSLAEWLRYRYLEHGERDIVQKMDELRRRQWLPLAMVALMVGLSFWNLLGIELRPRPPEVIWLPALVANAAMVALSLWMMWVGLREDRGLPFAAGVAYFLTWTVIRYIDLFGDMGGMLGAALLFFLCGCALLGVVFFWRQRKKVQYV